MDTALIKATRPRTPALRARDIERGLVSGAGLWQAIDAHAVAHRDCPLTFLSDQWPVRSTVGALLDRAQGVAAGLAALGFRPGDVLAIQLPHGEANVLMLLAAIRLGLVVSPLVPILGPAELGFVMRQTRARGLAIPARFRGVDYVARVRAAGDLPDCEHLLVLDDSPPSAGAGVVALADLLAPSHHTAPEHTANGDDVFAVIYTSGTTAVPKGVIHSHSSLEAEMLALGTLLRPPWSGGFLNAMPAGHIMGMIAALRPFFHGIPCVYMEHWDASRAVAAIREHDLVCSSANGFHLSQLLDHKGAAPLGRFRAILLGGAVIDPAIVEKAERHGIQAFRSYGSSELPSLTCGAPWDPLARRSHTDGRITPGNEFILVDKADRPVEVGERGEVLCRGAEMFQGFLDPALNDDAFTADGWYRTGDIAVTDEDGWLSIVDRKKDIIIRGGENLSSREIEETLATHPGVRAGAAVGYPDRLYGERVAAFVELDADASISLESVRTHFAHAGLARQKTPEALYVIDALPRTAAGKIIKAELRRRLAAEKTDPDQAAVSAMSGT